MDDISQRTKTGLKIRFLTDDKEEEVEERGRDRFGQRFVTERAQVLETFCPPRRDQEVGARVSIFSPGTEQRFSQFKQDIWCRSLFDLETDDQSWKGLSPSLGFVSFPSLLYADAKLLESVAFGEERGWEKTACLIARFGDGIKEADLLPPRHAFSLFISTTLESGNRWIAKLKGELLSSDKRNLLSS